MGVVGGEGARHTYRCTTTSRQSPTRLEPWRSGATVKTEGQIERVVNVSLSSSVVRTLTDRRSDPKGRGLLSSNLANKARSS